MKEKKPQRSLFARLFDRRPLARHQVSFEERLWHSAEHRAAVFQEKASRSAYPDRHLFFAGILTDIAHAAQGRLSRSLKRAGVKSRRSR